MMGPIRLILILVFFIHSFGIFPIKAENVRLPQLMSTSRVFDASHLAGMSIDPNNGLKFDFYVQRGGGMLDAEQKKDEYRKLVKYFLAALTVPDNNQWVNLSPYEHERIIEDNFGKTEMGRDLLAQDYILKQITSSLMYPESGLGKQFWDKVYEEAWRKFHTTQVPVSSFNKVWIVPDQAIVYEQGNTAYIIKSHLKVMLEEDHIALQKDNSAMWLPKTSTNNQQNLHLEKLTEVPQKGIVTPPVSLSTQIIKQIILPELEREVNEGSHFANLRQIVSSMILATWFKKTLKESLLGKIYADKAKVTGVAQPDTAANETIYRQYISLFKKGVYNYIKEDEDKYTHQIIPRKYFSGGFVNQAQITVIHDASLGISGFKAFATSFGRGNIDRVSVRLNPAMANQAMNASLFHGTKQFLIHVKHMAVDEKLLAEFDLLQYQVRTRLMRKAKSKAREEEIINEVIRDKFPYITNPNEIALLRPIFIADLKEAIAQGAQESYSQLKVTMERLGLSYDTAAQQAVLNMKTTLLQEYEKMPNGFLPVTQADFIKAGHGQGKEVLEALVKAGVIAKDMEGNIYLLRRNGQLPKMPELMHTPAYEAIWLKLTAGQYYSVELAIRHSKASVLKDVLNGRALDPVAQESLLTAIIIDMEEFVLRFKLHQRKISETERILAGMKSRVKPEVRASFLRKVKYLVSNIVDEVGRQRSAFPDLKFMQAPISTEVFWPSLNEHPLSYKISDAQAQLLSEAFILDARIALLENHGQGVVANAAMNAAEGVSQRDGGIDLNRANLNLIIQQEGNGRKFNISTQDLAQLSAIDGFDPQILDIQPVVAMPFLNKGSRKR